jgi:hypothetical protein
MKESSSKQIRIRPSTYKRIDKILEKHPHFRYPDDLISQMLDDREDAKRPGKEK